MSESTGRTEQCDVMKEQWLRKNDQINLEAKCAEPVFARQYFFLPSGQHINTDSFARNKDTKKYW